MSTDNYYPDTFPEVMERNDLMYVIEKIKILEPERLARHILERLPSIEPSPDNDGSFSNEEELDITLDDGLVVTGIISVSGYIKECRGDYFTPPECSTYGGAEVTDLKFWIDGDDIEVENQEEVEDWINRLL